MTPVFCLYLDGSSCWRVDVPPGAHYFQVIVTRAYFDFVGKFWGRSVYRERR